MSRNEAEKVFWDMVRDRRMFGLKFRRQQVIDGGVHDTEKRREYDRLRSEALELRKLKVLRFRNEENLGDEEDSGSYSIKYQTFINRRAGHLDTPPCCSSGKLK